MKSILSTLCITFLCITCQNSIEWDLGSDSGIWNIDSLQIFYVGDSTPVSSTYKNCGFFEFEEHILEVTSDYYGIETRVGAWSITKDNVEAHLGIWWHVKDDTLVTGRYTGSGDNTTPVISKKYYMTGTDPDNKIWIYSDSIFQEKYYVHKISFK